MVQGLRAENLLILERSIYTTAPLVLFSFLGWSLVQHKDQISSWNFHRSLVSLSLQTMAQNSWLKNNVYHAYTNVQLLGSHITGKTLAVVWD